MKSKRTLLDDLEKIYSSIHCDYEYLKEFKIKKTLEFN